MGWAALQPTTLELDHWQFKPSPGVSKVSWWPHPNSARINCLFRIKHTFPQLIPIAGRYGFYYHERFVDWDVDTPELNQMGAFEAVPIEANHVRLTLGENAEGFSVVIDIEGVEVTPNEGLQGVVCTVVITHATFGTQTAVGEYSVIPTRQNWFHNQNTDTEAPAGGWIYENDPTWTIPVLVPVLFAVADCYEFDRLPPEFASLNGADAYIELTDLMSFANSPFKMACEIRLNQTVNHWPILGRDGTGGFFGMEGDDIVFGNLQLDTSWEPITDTWFTWVYEFEPVTQLQHKLTIAGTVVKDATHSRQSPPFDMIGVYKHGVSGTLWADMDIRDLKIETGTPGDYETLLDMPLRVNALDVGPNANHGTTFNMRLPSV
jgi:hypothetical protein